MASPRKKCRLFGYGITVGYYLSITESLEYLRTHNQTCDYHLFFEDDGLPLNATTWPAYAPINNLDARLDELEIVGGTGLFVGGHSFDGVNRSAAAATASRPHGGVGTRMLPFSNSSTPIHDLPIFTHFTLLYRIAGVCETFPHLH